MKKWVAAACALVASVALYLTFFAASEEDRIQKVLRELAAIVSVKEDDTLLSRAARVRSRMKEVVADEVHVNVPDLGIDVRGRTKLEDDATRAGLLYQKADCDFTNVSIKVDPAGTMAQVDAVATVRGSRGGERKVDQRDVHFLIRKDGGWKISTIDVATRSD